MKKTIITILSTALITGIVFGGILVYTISQYEGLLSEIEEDISTTSFDYVVSNNRYDNLYEDYIIKAENSIIAKIKASKMFFTKFPGANKNINFSSKEPHFKDMISIFNIIEMECKKNVWNNIIK